MRLLPPHLVLSLLDSLAKRLEKRPQRAADLAPWVRAVLEHHAAYLMSQPSLPQRLSGLYQLATRRVATLPRLLSLSGRLDLMLAQIAKHSSAGRCVGPRQQAGSMAGYAEPPTSYDPDSAPN